MTIEKLTSRNGHTMAVVGTAAVTLDTMVGEARGMIGVAIVLAAEVVALAARWTTIAVHTLPLKFQPRPEMLLGTITDVCTVGIVKGEAV